MKPISQKDFAILIDAYADAKVSQNSYLIETTTIKVRSALDSLYSEQEEVAEA